MRFLARRLLFYLLAFFAAITLNFLLPRLMPGSPLDGLILRYGEAIRNNPDVLKQLQASLGSEQTTRSGRRTRSTSTTRSRGTSESPPPTRCPSPR